MLRPRWRKRGERDDQVAAGCGGAGNIALTVPLPARCWQVRRQQSRAARMIRVDSVRSTDAACYPGPDLREHVATRLSVVPARVSDGACAGPTGYRAALVHVPSREGCNGERVNIRSSMIRLAGLALLVGTLPVGAIDFGNLNLDSVVKGGQGALKAASLTDGDIRDLTEKSCAAMDSQSRVAPPTDAYATRLTRVMKDMPTSVDGQTVNYKVYLTKDVNAWAMANGCVRVYSGLMDLMDDDELRGVIGHEEGHVALGHSRKAMQTAYATSAARELAGAAGGNVAALTQSQLGELAEQLVNAQFSQSQESEADNYSFDLLTKQKLKREGLVTSFQKLAKLDGGKSSMLSSHPSSTDRAANMQKRIDGKA